MPTRLLAVLAALTLAAADASAQTKPPAAPPAKEVKPPEVPPELADWTPRPGTGPVEPWEKATDKDWIDGRFRQMNTGPFLNATFRYPLGKDKPWVYKGTAIKLGEKGDAAVLFDRGSLRLAAGWTGGWLNISDRRFGLMNTPTPAGEMVFALPSGPGWASPDGKWDAKGAGAIAPLPKEWAKYRGLYVLGNRVVLKSTVGDTEVLESPLAGEVDGSPVLAIHVEVGPTKQPLVWRVTDTNRGGQRLSDIDHFVFTQPHDDRVRIAAVLGIPTHGFVSTGRPPGCVVIPPSEKARRFSVLYTDMPAKIGAGYDKSLLTFQTGIGLSELVSGNRPRWGKPIVTKLVRGDGSGPFAVDTLTIPYDNPFKALFFCTGLDFLPDGRIAVCTCHGDVWLVRVDEAKGECHWQRFATGLYQPLGLKVVDGKVVVLERGQLTRLHDLNGDGEADFYECLCNDWDTGTGEHSYDTCLDTDPGGNFYFFKTGDTNLPTGGCLMKVSKDGGKAEVFATGFRHPIGLGISPTGVITGADQEGNWMPATRIDEYKKGGFYGDMRAHHRQEPPKIYDGPLCWVPREVDNSAGGQAWVPADSKWPLAGLPLHFSYGRCKAFVLLRQPFEGGSQGGVWDLGLRFLSGVCRGRFAPDGHLYVCGLNGWQTCAQADGCLQRVRYTGKPLDVPVKLEVVPDGVNLTFSRPLDRAAAEDPARYRAAWWGYRWSGEYGSKRYKVSGPGPVESLPWFPRGVDLGGVGQDDVPVTAAKLSGDGRTVHVTVPGVRPVMQMQLGVNLRAADGAAVVGSVFLTVHQTGK
jgi:hypothetical protein